MLTPPIVNAPDLLVAILIQVKRLREWGHGEPSPIGLGLERNADFWLLDDWRTSPYVEEYKNIWVDYDMDYPLALMQANVHMKSFMKKYFPRRNPFYELAMVLLKLEPALTETIMEARQARFARHTIGVQIRRLKGHSDYLPPVENYARLALAIQQEKGWTDEDTAFFLATDTPSVYVDMMKALPGRTVVNLKCNLTLGRQESANPGTLEDALIDMRLLSMCNEIIVTYGSSFGSTAAAWGGLKAYVILHGGSLELNDALTHVSGAYVTLPVLGPSLHIISFRCDMPEKVTPCRVFPCNLSGRAAILFAFTVKGCFPMGFLACVHAYLHVHNHQCVPRCMHVTRDPECSTRAGQQG